MANHKGTSARYTFLLEIMLRKGGFNYGKELKKALLSDLSKSQNYKYLNALIRLLPYTCVDVSQCDATRIKEVMAICRTKQQPEKLILESEDIRKLNNILADEKELKVASGGKGN